MLTFLRKHQRIFFIFITAAIVVSFCFFGTYSTFNSLSETVSDREVVRGVAGAPIMHQELSALCRLIESSPLESMSREKGTMPNFLNDGVIEKDFLSSGLAVMLSRSYFEEVRPDLDERIKKIHHFRPYAHPSSAQISAENAWGRFAPDFLKRFRLLKEKSHQPTSESLALMSQLYLDQAGLPPDLLRQILQMQQSQLGVQPDPRLAHGDLALFGFKNLEDWFGPRFISLIGQFIINAAQIAESNGYDVKMEEIRSDLFQNIYSGYQQFAQNGQLKAEEANQYYQMKMRNLGMDETMLLSAWKKVILFRRLFDDGSGSVLIDPLAFQQFAHFAKENTRISLYQLPSSLQLGDFRSLLKLQVYLEAVAVDPSRLKIDLRIPAQLASLEQIEKRTPELVQRPIEIEWSEASKVELSKAISVKETWAWESSSQNWEALKSQFSELAAIKADSTQERLAALECLEAKLRLKVDQFARSQMIGEQPDKIKWALENAPAKTATVSLKIKGSSFPFAGIKDTSELAALLENAALKGEMGNAANERLSFYSPDDGHYYRIAVLSRDGQKKLLSFALGSKDGTLDALLDKRLEPFYMDARKRNPQQFQQENGQFKPFKEVKDLVGKHAYADLLRSIEEHYRTEFGMLPGKEGELPMAFYCNARLMPHMQEVKNRLKVNPQDTSLIKVEGEDSLSSQWKLEKTEKTVERQTDLPFSKEEMFALAANEWSPVKIGERGALAFYFVHEKGHSSALPLESMEQGHQILSFDAKRDMMLGILQKIQQQKAIDLSKALAEERD